MTWRYLLSAPTPSAPGAEVLSAPTLGGLLIVSVTALVAVFYSVMRGKLRSEASLKEIREDCNKRVDEARADRDARLEEARLQIEMWKNAHENSEASRRSQEALLRETTMEIGRTVQYIIVALQEARLQAHGPLGIGEPRDYGQDA